ncbi:MAG TPA: ABC transporter substrate-binding protein, partial [Acidimicrobiia bacterium]|nr:ABC transporter substrate-binding protein [Acidimicrobiia bacterium]
GTGAGALTGTGGASGAGGPASSAAPSAAARASSTGGATTGGGAASGSGSAPVRQSAAAQPGTAAAGGPPAGSGSRSGSGAPTPGVPGGEGGAAPGNRAPVIIGSITHLSGPAASGTLPALDGLQIWVKFINDKGGLNGHVVKLLVADDNTDSARHRQLTQEMVEQKGVIAFLQQGEALTGASSVGYNTEHQIPVINSSGGNDYYYEAPTYFPIAAHGKEFVRASLYNAGEYGKATGRHKYGVLMCSEAPICDTTDQIAGNADNVRAAGLELVYKVRVSLVQPDFTAECIQARNAGVEILQIALDGNGVGRVAASCNRQNFHPFISVFGAIAFDKMKENPDLDGLTVNANSFPYFLCDDPRAKEYCAAYQRYGPAKVYGIGNTNGWMAGKALERAARNLQTPTSQAVLDGMWSFKDETLGGLVQPLTFTKGQNAPRQPCWWPLVLTGGKWTAPNGVNVKCR